MKKIISVMTAVLVILSIIPNVAFAQNNDKVSIETVVNELKNSLPEGTVITVTEDEEINVSMSEPIDSNEYSILATTSSTYAPDGGSYRNFHSVPFSTVQPYSIVFLNEERAQALVYSLNNSSLFNDVIIWSASYGIEIIISLVLSKYGLAISPIGISFLVFIGSWTVLEKYDAYSAMNAWKNSSTDKIVIQRVSNQGWPVNYYFAWESNYCSPDPYYNWNPTFYRDEYDI
ncbi:MAG: hypothetical protein ACERKV_00780 [Clostridiaceae bacterium]